MIPHAPPSPDAHRWRSFDVRTDSVERVVLDVFRPLEAGPLADAAGSYWTPGYVGGPHARLNVRSSGTLAATLEAELRASIGPAECAVGGGGYDPERAARMLREEGHDPSEFDLALRPPGVHAGRYVPPASHLGPAAVSLTEAFYEDSRPAAYAVLSAEARRVAALRLFFVRALAFGGSLRGGALSFRSHWERFRAEWPAEVTVPIEAAYDRDREGIRDVMIGTLAAWEAGPGLDPVVDAWGPVMTSYRARIVALVRAGELTEAVPTDPAAYLRTGRARAREAEAESPFLDALFEDEAAFTRMATSPGMLVGRMHVNLLYLLVRQGGLPPIERFALGHFAYRAIEDHHGCDLAELLHVHLS